MNGFITYLYERLLKPLPGFEAQKLMMPISEHFTNHSAIAPPESIPCSVLVLLCEIHHKLSVLLTLRSTNLSSHKGQISFPGGKLEPQESAEKGALRETFEEVGIATTHIQLIGRISSFYMIHNNMQIQPIIAVLNNSNPIFKLNKAEVEEAFWLSLDDLIQSNAIKREQWDIHGNTLTVPFWDVEKSAPLWGATAMILSELLVLYKDFLQSKKSIG